MNHYYLYRKINNTGDEYQDWENIGELSLPFTYGFLHDETLDSGKVNLCLTHKIELEPFTLLKITNGSAPPTGFEIYCFSGTHTSVRKRMGNPVAYDYDIEVLELTKILERTYLQSITFTRPIEGGNWKDTKLVGITKATTDSLGKPGFAEEERFDAAVNAFSSVVSYFYIPKSYAPSSTGYEMPRLSSLLSYTLKPADQVRFYDCVLKDYPRIRKKDGDTYGAWMNDVQFFKPELKEDGTPQEYEIQYIGWECSLTYGIPAAAFYRGFSLNATTICEASNEKPLTAWTIPLVCERLRSVAYLHYPEDKAPFKISEWIAYNYGNVKAPEFTFTNKTLFEAYLEVAKFVNAIPRLAYEYDEFDGEYRYGFVLEFDKLNRGSLDYYAAELESHLIGEQESYSIEDFSNELIVPSQTLVNTLGKGETTDIDGAYITTRTEISQYEINADSSVIRTAYPIYKLLKLEIAPIKTKTGFSQVGNGDITKYVRESSVYRLLDIWAGAPKESARAFALEWTRGSDTIKGLNFQPKALSSTSSAFQNPAILNIIRDASTGFASLKPEDIDYTQLAFRVTYIPKINGRFAQKRHRKAIENGFRNDVVFNQGSNIAEATYMGRNIMGAAARMGNKIIRKSYQFDRVNIDFRDGLLGRKIGNLVISSIDLSYGKEHVQATLTFTKDFNRLNAYTALNSQLRLYEIAEDQATERQALFERTIEINRAIGDYPEGDTITPFHKALLTPLLGVVHKGYDYPQTTINVAKCNTISEDESIKTFFLPVLTFPFGKSVVAHMECYDNYGVGFQSRHDFIPDGSRTNKSMQRLVPYTDLYGRFDKMNVSFNNKAWDFKNEDTIFQNNDNGQSNNYPEVTKEYVKEGNVIRQESFNVWKDSREKISVDYQIHFDSANEDIAVFPGIADDNGIIEDDNIYLIPIAATYTSEIDLLTGYVDEETKERYKVIRVTEDDSHASYNRCDINLIGACSEDVKAIKIKKLKINVTELTPVEIPDTSKLINITDCSSSNVAYQHIFARIIGSSIQGSQGKPVLYQETGSNTEEYSRLTYDIVKEYDVLGINNVQGNEAIHLYFNLK